ncbi:fatty acid synthase [Amylocarpus encephaloides]|uniref:Fatty acid synthase n=1 Tax=Amylocarpus encephaloides TaxID=45428 RepID=A0A9P7YSC5_9HELO|nr:fatty acid synthase [Amylocarpus encephaloides]
MAQLRRLCGQERIIPFYTWNSSIPTTSSEISSSRPSYINYGPVRLAVPIKDSVRLLFHQLRDDFLSEFRYSFDEESEENDISSARAVCLERFIQFVLKSKFSEADSIITDQGSLLVLEALIQAFEDQVSQNDDVHTAVSLLTVSSDDKRQIVSTIVRASHLMGRSLSHYKETGSPRTALFQAIRDHKATAYAIFGGQGTDNYFDSLGELYATYEPLMTPLILRASSHLRQRIALEEAYQSHFPKSLNVLLWLRSPETRPDAVYLASAPVSFPLIALLQLTAFEVVARLLCLSPSGMCSMFSGTTGHSQGIVTAAIIAAATDWVSFHSLAMEALGLLLSIGCHSQSAAVAPPARHALISDALDHGEGTPSAMLSVRHIPLRTVEKLVQEINIHLPPNAAIEIALHNERTNFVLAGPPASLHGFNVRLRDIKAAPGQDQARIPFDKRKPAIVNRFLPISAPFHSSHLSGAVASVLQDVQAHNGLRIRGFDLHMPVYSTSADGTDLRQCGTEDIVPKMIRMIIEEPLHWSAATKLPNATHIIDFGPGRAGAGAGGLIHGMKEGSGARVLNALLIDNSRSFGGLGELLARARPQGYDITPTYGPDWSCDHGPSLVKTVAMANKCLVNTKMSRLLGLPPIMVAGMTPTTCNPEFVAAIINAGFHVEFATGGYQDAAALETALRVVAKGIPAGRGITCNLIYANPTALQWQLTLLRALSASGAVPIDGLTFGAGVPSVDVANDYITSFPTLKHMSFKPGSQNAIRQVVAIAKANSSFPVILQWTGGRAGGHHSFEDFHDPILHSYVEIRSQGNIILVAGSGFGNVDGSYPYLTGEWTKQFGLPAMPFDGILLGSRAMIAKEAKTSRGAKEAIVKAAGVENSQWSGTYKQPTGGVLTVISEMGEPIHVLATRGMRLWAELDTAIFSVTDKKERVRLLHEKKTYIIEKLNADYQKLWFGQSTHGDVVVPVDLEDMTYAEVTGRLIQLLFIRDEKRWVHPSLKQLVFDFIRHAESRFIKGENPLNFSVLNSVTDLDSAPESFANQLFADYPEMNEDLIGYQDAQYFLSLCRRRGQKPVPFVPALDDYFETWFKKDSLWQSEDLAAVPDGDIDRICILQGPVAAKHARIVDEPIKDILDDLHSGFVARLTESKYSGKEAEVPAVDCYMNTSPVTSESSLSDLETRLRALGGLKNDWRQAFFTCKTIVQDRKIVESPVRRLFQHEHSTLVQVDNTTEPGKTSVSLSEINSHGESTKVVEVRLQSCQTNIIELSFFEHRTATKRRAELLLKFKYCPEFAYAPIHEIMEGREERIRCFYRQVWFGDDVETSAKGNDSSIRSEFYSGPVHVTARDIKQLATTLQNLDSIFTEPLGKRLVAPMDFAIVAAWKPLMQPLFVPDIQGDLLNLVHLSNSYRMVPNAVPIVEGDIVTSTARVTAVVNQTSGKMIEVRGRVSKGDFAIIDIESRFFFRGTYNDHEKTFQITEEEPIQLRLESASDVAVLQAKPWFHVSESALQLLQPQSTLVFHLQTETRPNGSKSVSKHVKTTGWVEAKLASKRLKRLGSVEYTATESPNNPVLSYLQRKGEAESARVMFETPRPLFEGNDDMVIELPISNEAYATVSGDYNPIHVSRTLASYASLPGPITHGMFASGRVRALIEKHLHSSSTNFFKAFHCAFAGMMLPGDKLQLSLHHVGMVSGTRIIKFEATRLGSGETILLGEAEVDPPKTAYLFTGQGSQKVGMGMELYGTSEVAREVWDRADRHFLDTYGLRITNIVKNNPKQLVVYFGGLRGRAIRQKYMDLTFSTTTSDGTVLRQRCFPEINSETLSYTFSSPTGLLSATQFTQPALTLMEIATYKDLAKRGLVSRKSAYAGHSLGEYSALCAVAELLPIEALMSIVFYRGLAMQFAVERDQEGRSEFGMCAVNPARLSKPVDGACLQRLSGAIASTTSTLLEVVNFNIEGQQYVCAGHLLALKVLGDVLDHTHKAKISLEELVSQSGESGSAEFPLHSFIRSIVDKTLAPQDIKATGLQRGIATIPLVGIDVPFHSSYLHTGVSSFRRHLYEKIPQNSLDLDRLVGKYIPNLTAEPFEISRAYFKTVLGLTGSKVVGDMVQRWDEFETWSPGQARPIMPTLVTV